MEQGLYNEVGDKAKFGYSVAVGDFSGDGVDDVSRQTFEVTGAGLLEILLEMPQLPFGLLEVTLERVCPERYEKVFGLLQPVVGKLVRGSGEAANPFPKPGRPPALSAPPAIGSQLTIQAAAE